MPKARYNLNWDDDLDDAQIECSMIRWGGKWLSEKHGVEYGNGLFFHYKRLFRLYWPHEDEHRWEDAGLETILSNQFSTLMGSTGSTKTSTAAKFALCFYSVWPKGTTILISSTDMRGLEMRVFGRIKELVTHAKARYDWFPGNVIDSKKVIATDDIEEDETRDLRDGITCIPCLSSSGSFVGLGKYIGIHNTRLLFVGDEMQLMQLSLLESVPNLLNNPFAKFIFLGNPLAQGDPLDKVSEPKEGWSSIGIPEKTTRWNCKYMDGVCLNLPGKDSPNYDFPADKPDRYGYMVGRRKEQMVRESYGEGSQQYCSQILGVRVEGLTARKIITRDICNKFDAFRLPIWNGDGTTKVYAVDAAYGSIGGDRCVGGWVEFGRDVNLKQVLCIGQQKIIPISSLNGIPPDDQIAAYVQSECAALDIPDENIFFDGRTMLMSAFARLNMSKVNPVDFGAQPTIRPVSLDLFIEEEETGVKRLKRCDEHYSKFVTELWFSVRYAVESGQICGLTEEILNDGVPREWKTVRGNKLEAESKSEMKKRTGKSPDLFDQLVTAVEGARRLGFQISKLAAPPKSGKNKLSALDKLSSEWQDCLTNKELKTV